MRAIFAPRSSSSAHDVYLLTIRSRRKNEKRKTLAFIASSPSPLRCVRVYAFDLRLGTFFLFCKFDFSSIPRSVCPLALRLIIFEWYSTSYRCLRYRRRREHIGRVPLVRLGVPCAFARGRSSYDDEEEKKRFLPVSRDVFSYRRKMQVE